MAHITQAARSSAMLAGARLKGAHNAAAAAPSLASTNSGGTRRRRNGGFSVGYEACTGGAGLPQRGGGGAGLPQRGERISEIDERDSIFGAYNYGGAGHAQRDGYGYDDDDDDDEDGGGGEAARVRKCARMLDAGVPTSPTMRAARAFVHTHSATLESVRNPDRLALVPRAADDDDDDDDAANAAARYNRRGRDDDDDDDDDRYNIRDDGGSDEDAGGGGGGGSHRGGLRGAAVAPSEPEGDAAPGGWQEQRRAAAAAAVGDVGERVQRAALKRDYARLVTEPATAAEEEFQLDHDDESLRWRPAKHPNAAALDAELGEPQPRSECWGCLSGDPGMSSIASRALDQLRDLYVRNRMEVSAAALGVMLEAFYETQLRAPTLRQAAKQRANGCGVVHAPLPVWRAATIVDHFRNHRLEPQAKIEKRIEQHSELADHIADHCIYRVPAALKGRAAPADVRINGNAVRHFLAVTASERAWYSLNAKQLHGFSDDLRLEHAARSFVRTKHNMVPEIRRRVLFEAEAPVAP